MKKDSYKLYYGDNTFLEAECCIYDCSNPKNTESQFSTLESADPSGASRIMLHYLMADGGDPSAIRELGRRAAEDKNLDYTNLLAAKRKDGTPGLLMALHGGHADAIKAYGDLLQLLQSLPDNERAQAIPELLAAKSKDGIPGLLMALHGGHADAIKAYGDLLQSLPDNERAQAIPELLAAKRTDGTPGLFMALQNGHADAIKAYRDLLPLLPNNERTQSLANLLGTNINDLQQEHVRAMHSGHNDNAGTAYKELLTNFKAIKSGQLKES